MANQTGTEEVDAFGQLYRFLLFIAAAFGFVIYLQIVRNRQLWAIMEIGIGVCSIAVFPFIHYLLSLVSISEDHHLLTYMSRLMILGMTAQAAAVYLTKDSPDPTVGLSVSVYNILTRSTILLCCLHELYYGQAYAKFPIMKGDFVFLSLLILGDLLHMSKVTTNEGSRTVGDPISFHLSVDALISFLLGALILGFSDMFFAVLNTRFTAKYTSKLGYLLVTKIFGCTIFGGSILSFASICFKRDEDAIATLKSKLTIYLPTVLLAITNAFIDQYYQTYGHSLLMLGVFGGLALNAGFAVWQYEKKKQE